MKASSMPPEVDSCKGQNSEKHTLLRNELHCVTCAKYRTAPDPVVLPLKAWVEDDDDERHDSCEVCNDAPKSLKLNSVIDSDQCEPETKSVLSDCNRNQPRLSITSKKNQGCIIKVWDPQDKLLHKYNFKNKGPSNWCDHWKNLNKCVQKLQPPYFILSFTLIVILVYLCANDSTLGYLEFSGERRSEVWRLLSYTVAHRGAVHVILNSALALAVGAPLEREQGATRTFVVSALGAAVGAIGAAVLHPHLRLIGASAAVYSMLTSHLGHVCLNYSTLSLKWFRLLAVALLALSDTVWLLWYRQSDQLQLIAWTAHGFGGLIGFLLSFVIYKGDNTESKYLVAAKWTSVTILGTGFAVLLFFYTYPLTNTTVVAQVPGKI